jgi:hypothetical protein
VANDLAGTQSTLDDAFAALLKSSACTCNESNWQLIATLRKELVKAAAARSVSGFNS